MTVAGKNLIWWVALIMMIALFGACADEGKDYLATPEKTIQTYLAKARYLKSVTDPLAYSRAIDCFSKPAIEWWKQNAESLIPDKSELDGYSGSKREAYVFGNYVVPTGPTLGYGKPNIEKVSGSGDEVNYKVNGKELTLVKEGKNWRFKSLFGLDGR